MSEAALISPRLIVDGDHPLCDDLGDDGAVCEAARSLCEALPYREQPYRKRNWGGQLHSLCSYQGKLKPAIAHFLVKVFTAPGSVVLDPMAGVGTIPLEARIQGRVAIAGDLSELAAVVSKAKLERFTAAAPRAVIGDLAASLAEDRTPLPRLVEDQQASFGLNGPIVDYFHPETLREVLIARRFFSSRLARISSAEAVVLTCLLHVLHGNRPYALSRRSHPVTPLRPTGPSEYRSVLEHLQRRVEGVLPALESLPGKGRSYRRDFGHLPIAGASVDAVITSPPFAKSLRFFSANWLRLWLCGWGRDDFRQRPEAFLERRQATHFEQAYEDFLERMARVLRPGGLLIMHLGETRHGSMAEAIADLVRPPFEVLYVGRENVSDTESHGLTDKGATRAHGFLFCRRG